MKQSNHFRTSTLIAATCITIGLATSALANPITPIGDYSDGPVPELFVQPEDLDLNQIGVYKNAPVVHQMILGDGWVDFVEQPDGSIGIGYVGDTTASAVTKLLHTYKATPLEVFMALNDTRQEAPAELIDHHRKVARGDIQTNSNPRQLPNLNDLLNGGVQEAGFFGENFTGSGACAGNQNFDLFTNWFSSNGPSGSTLGTNNPSYEDLGVKGITGDGIASGNANITLGGSSGGAIAFCKTAGLAGKPTLRIAEYIHQVGWVWIWQFNDIMNSGSAIGYYFGGYAYRHIRMEIRDAAGVEFFWAAAY